MRKNKLLLLLALLMTAATGAWAEDIVISPASGADISTALATATDGKTVGNITINLAQNGAYTVSSAMEVPAGLTINGNGATINAKSLTEGNGMFLGTGKDSPTRADIQISDLTIKSLGKSLYYSNGKKNYGDFIMNNCLVEVTSSVIVFNYTKGSAVVNLTLTNSTFYAPTATTTQFYSSQSGQKLTEFIIDATQKFSFQNCTLYNMAKNKNFFSHRQNSQKWLSYEAKNSIFVNCGKSGEVVKGMNGGSAANDNPTWSIDGNLFNYDGADTSANETTGDTSEGEGVQNSVAGVVTFKDPSNGDFSGIITKSDNSTVDLTLGDPRWTAAAEPATYTVTMKDGVKDADKWTVKVGEGQAQALPIGGLKGDGKETVTLQYNGRLKVKGVKATSDAAPAAKEPATVTTAPTGAAIVGVGKTTALVSGGAADGGTLMYAVTTTNTKPASTDGFSDKVPTAKDITASGTVYVWYYVKGDDTHTDSEIAGPVSVTLAEEITWNTTNVFNSSHQNDKLNFTKKTPLVYEGITISYSGDDAASHFYTYHAKGGKGRLQCYGENGAKFTFTAPSGKKFVRIEMTDDVSVYSGDANWIEIEDENKLVWSGTPSNTVEIAGDDLTKLSTLNTIVFNLVDAE